MNPDELITFLREHKLFAPLSVEEIKELLPFIKVRHFAKGSWIFQEGEEGRDLFMIEEGEAKVLKEEKEYSQYEELASLERGDYFGEMAHLENEKRSASVRATKDSQILALDLDGLEKSTSRRTTYAKIIIELGKRVSRHLRKADEKLLFAFNERLKISQSFNQISKTLVHIFILGAIWFNISQLINMFPLEKPILDPIFSAVFAVFFTASIVYIIKSSGYPLSFYGLTLYRWFESAIQGALYSIPILILMVILKWILIHQFDLFKDFPLFVFSDERQDSGSLLLLSGLYLLTTPLQELIARGFLQSCFRNFFQGENRGFLAILSSNLLFQMLHTVRGFWLAIASFILGIFWGILFEQQKSLVGVSVSHAIIGTFGFFVLDFNTMITLAG
jgi:CRP-like cAMP-binding protein/membrane protease YdiL (CAAX protease family)